MTGFDAEAQLRVVSDTTRAFLEATTNLEDLLATVVDRIAHVIGDSCSVLLLSDDRTVLVPAALFDTDLEALKTARTALAEPLTLDRHVVMAQVVATGEPYLQSNVDLEHLRPPRSTPVYFDFAQRVGLHSVLLVALRVHGATIGVLGLTRHRRTSAGYDNHDLAVAQILADHAALAIANSRLYAAERAARIAAREADSALRETERSHQRFFELSPLATFIYDSATERVLTVNAAALRMFGYTEQEFMAVELAALRSADDDVAATAARIATAGDGDIGGTRRIRRKDGGVVDVEVWSYVAMFEGRTARLVVITDVTDRSHLLEARASEARFRGLLEGAPDAVVIADDQGHIVLVNGQTETVFGYDRTELVGQAVEILIPHRYRTNHPGNRTGYFHEATTRAMGSALELYGLRKDGTEFPVEVSLSPLATEQGLLVMSTIRDATQRRQVATALTVANHELEAFSYSVAHDLRAPLRSINGFAQILSDTNKDKLDEDGVDCVREILAGSRKMAGLIDALLSLARTSRSAVNITAGDLSAIARAVSSQLAASHPERTVAIVIQDGLRAQFDPRLVEVLFDNLLANAWKFTAKVAHARIEFFATETAGGPAYCVRDNGAGFDMKFATNLFAPFQRLHSTNEFPGTGIGLATAQRIVHRHGGRIWAEAALGKGAAFHFTLAGARSVMP